MENTGYTENTTYANRQNAVNKLIDARVRHEKALKEFENATENFYTSIANILCTRAHGEKNAKPASYFAKLMSDNPREQHGIATTIGVCGDIANSDCWVRRTTNNQEDISNGNTHKFLPYLRRKLGEKTTRWAEVDENGNVIGPIRERKEKIYLYYWAD